MEIIVLLNTSVIHTSCMCSCALLELCLAVLDVWENQRRQTWMSVACPATGGRHRAGRASGRKNRESPYILEQVAKVIVAMRMQGVGRTVVTDHQHGCNLNANVLTAIDDAERICTYAYDPNGRLTETKYPDDLQLSLFSIYAKLKPSRKSKSYLWDGLPSHSLFSKCSKTSLLTFPKTK